MKDEILKTAQKQFMKFGIREMSIQRLSEGLGISTKTLYKYFQNKEQLLEEIVLIFYDQQFDLLKDLAGKKNTVQLFLEVWYVAIEREHKVNSIFFQELQNYYPGTKEKIEKTVGKKFNDQFIEIIKKGVSDGFFRKGIIPEVVMEGIYLFYNGIARNGQFRNVQVSPLDLLLNTIGIYIRGFCTEKGVQQLDAYILTLKPFGKPLKTRKKLIKQA
ncbi:MAG TPA: TetR/AcrR family transcriptional regulator [Cytophagales bacterium]|nr:TetR/AcrR family transcriptional regulator [Cytophagales bacterium]